jgi:regulator of RNase E activity RraA
MIFNNRDDIIQLTPEWKGERFQDGRPRVSDDTIDRIRNVKIEEAWMPIWDKGYKYQFEGRFKVTHHGRRICGRAVTAVMVPSRPDVHLAMLEYGRGKEGRHGFFNQWVIETLVEGDIIVVDMCDKIFQGTFVGGNLSTAIKSRTKNGGAVIWGGIRDLEQIVQMDDFQVYYRGVDPTPIGDVMMTGMNVPCRIGNAICMPGDIVLGTISGILFIPSHLAEDVAIRGEKIQVKDIFGFERLASKTYTSAQIDAKYWSKEVMADFINWLAISPAAENYRHLEWVEELEQSEKVQTWDFTGLA